MKVKVYGITEREIDDEKLDELFDEETECVWGGRKKCHIKPTKGEKKVRILAVNKYGIKTDWDDEKVDWVHIYDDYSVEVFKKKKGDLAIRVSEPGTYAMDYTTNTFVAVEKLVNRMAAGLNRALTMLKTITDLVIEDAED